MGDYQIKTTHKKRPAVGSTNYSGPLQQDFRMSSLFDSSLKVQKIKMTKTAKEEIIEKFQNIQKKLYGREFS